MYKKIKTDKYIADTYADLKTIDEKDIGASCYVIKEACEYQLLSTGEWIKQSNFSTTSSNVDLSNCITKDESNEIHTNLRNSLTSLEGHMTILEQDAKNEIDEVKNNAILKFFNMNRNPGGHDAQSIYLNANSGSLTDTMINQGLGVYNVWIEKGNPCLPKTMLADNTSGRGIAVVDFQQDGDTIGYAILFDKKNRMFYQFLNHNTPMGWMKVAAEKD